jgi:hypothetical protein
MAVSYKKPIIERKIRSNQSKTRYYCVCLGEVDWTGKGKYEIATYIRIIIIEDGKPFYKGYSAHILMTPGNDGRSDFDNVMNVFSEIQESSRSYLTNIPTQGI